MTTAQQVNDRRTQQNQKRNPIQITATRRCTILLGKLIQSERMLRPSVTTNRSCLTYTELAVMANRHLDQDEPDISSQTVKNVEQWPSPTRSWRSIVCILNALGYHATWSNE